MANFLLVLSITLNLAAFLCIIILYLRQNKLFGVEKEQEKNLREIEDAITSFIQQLKEENEEFFDKLTEIKVSETTKNSEIKVQSQNIEKLMSTEIKKNKVYLNRYKSKPSESIPAVEQKDTNIEHDEMENLLNLILPSKNGEQEEKIEPQVKVKEEKTLLDQALELQEEGKTLEEIAKKLHKGKTEIELLLKFRQN